MTFDTQNAVGSSQTLMIYSTQKALGSSQTLIMIHNTQNALGSSGLCKPSSDNEHKRQELRSFFLLLMLLVQSEYIPDSWILSILGDRKVYAYATTEPEV